MGKFELVRFTDDGFELDVRADLQHDTVWLTQDEMAALFGRERSVIAKHIRNALTEELKGVSSVCAKFARTGSDGKKYDVDYYNLEVITSVGYRVKSQRGVALRKWANSILKDYLIQGYAVNQKRLENLGKTIDIQNRMLAYSLNIDKEELSKVINEYTTVAALFAANHLFQCLCMVCDIPLSTETENPVMVISPWAKIFSRIFESVSFIFKRPQWIF